MADALGILGFALHAAHKIYDIVQTLKDAPEEIRALQTEAALVRAFLPDLLTSLEHDANHPVFSNTLQLQILLEQAERLGNGVESFLAKVTKRKPDGTYRISRLRYLFRASGGQDLREQFKNFLILLNAINSLKLVRVVTFSAQQLYLSTGEGHTRNYDEHDEDSQSTQTYSLSGRTDEADTTLTTLVKQMPTPIASSPEASAAVEALKRGLYTYMEDMPWLSRSLDDISMVHPFVAVTTTTFKVVNYLTMRRRSTDKRMLPLYATMADTMSVLVQLRYLRDLSDVDQTRARWLQSLVYEAATEIKACANFCDVYEKQRPVVKALKSEVWESQVIQWVGTLTKRRTAFELALSIADGESIGAAKDTVRSMDIKLAGLMEHLPEVLRELTPTEELQLLEQVRVKGGVRAVRKDEETLRELCELQADSQSSTRRPGVGGSERNQGQAGSSALSSSGYYGYTIDDLKDELYEDSQTVFKRNLETFDGKFALVQRMIQEELERTVPEASDRVIEAVCQDSPDPSDSRHDSSPSRAASPT